MTSFDRIEPRIADLMEELAAPRIPDYFDTMLGQTALSPQRPAWQSLERWLPMGTMARITPTRQVPWRPIAVAVILLLLAAAGLALYAGSQRQVPVPAPPPFGPATNGTILISTDVGEILTVDAVTGATRPVITDDATDQAPGFAANGRTFTFDRVTGERGLWVAGADGSDPRRLVDTTQYELQWIEWSQAGDRVIALGQDSNLDEVILLIDPATGSQVALTPDRIYQSASMPFGGDQLVLSAEESGGRRYFVMDVDDPANPRPLPASAFAVNEPALSPDGTKLVYATWNDGLGTGGNLRLLDIDAGTDTLLTPVGNDIHLWQAPQFMPDGTSVIAGRWSADGTYRLSVVPIDGSGAERAIGPVRNQDGGGATAWVSPDGTEVLATYHDDGIPDDVTWSIDVASGVGTELVWPAPAYLTWQRIGS